MSITSHPSIHSIQDNAISKLQISRKRKRGDHDHADARWKAFEIRPDPSEPQDKPRVFIPLGVLPRAEFPLSHLDTSQTGARTFAAQLEVLEKVNDSGIEATVLIAECRADQALYAIERVHKRVYALCKLCDWVNKELLQSQSPTEAWTTRSSISAPKSGGASVDWWQSAAVEAPSASIVPVDRPCKASVSLTLREPVVSHEQPAPERMPLEAIAATSEGLVEATAGTEAAAQDDQRSVDDIFTELVAHYMDALYISRTSLAYFAKGPLSRVRAAYSNLEGTGLEDLITSLRETIHSPSTLDKKYREKIPQYIKELPIRGPLEKKSRQNVKKSRKKKLKTDKYGMFPDESEYAERWWHADEFSSGASSAETTEAAIRRRVPGLRGRETFLQVLLVLETLALETSFKASITQPSKEDSVAPNSKLADPAKAVEVKMKRTKKPHDLSAVLDTLIERLCIWHSLDQGPESSGKTGESLSGHDGRNNELQSFSVEVIIPFYMSRIPEVTANVNKKLGGPSAPTPVKRKQKIALQPGEPAMRLPLEKKPGKPLQRVLTDTLNRPSRPAPSLTRSATDSLLVPYIKREDSETPLSTIQAKSIRRPPTRRESLLHSIPFGKREVDLSAMSQATEVKMRKKAEVEEKLREAITTLKRPNRALAVKDITDSADLSHAKATGREKVGQTLKTRAQGVHVAATPKHTKTSKGTPSRNAETTTAHAVRSFGTSLVPSSTAKPLRDPATYPRSLLEVPATGHRSRRHNIDDTPSRGFAKFMPSRLAREPGALDSPVALRCQLHQTDPASVAVQCSTAVQQTPSKPAKTWSLAETPVSRINTHLGAPLGSSLEPPALLHVGAFLSVTQGTAGEKKQAESIYDALGWNGDDGII